MLRVIKGAAILTAMTAAMGSAAYAESAQDMMMSRLGTTEADPVIVETFNRAAMPVTPELRAKALECWNNEQLRDRHRRQDHRRLCRRLRRERLAPRDGDGIHPAGADLSRGRQDPVLLGARRRLQGDLGPARLHRRRASNVIVVFADARRGRSARRPEARRPGIKVVLHNGTEVGTARHRLPDQHRRRHLRPGRRLREGRASRAIPTPRPSSPWAARPATRCQPPGRPAPSRAGRNPCRACQIVAKLDTNWTQEGTLTAVTAALSQFDPVDGYIYEYADGFRGAVRAYEAAKPDGLRRRAAHRRAGPVLRLGSRQPADNFKIFYSSGQNFQSRFALTAAMMAHSRAPRCPHRSTCPSR